MCDNPDFLSSTCDDIILPMTSPNSVTGRICSYCSKPFLFILFSNICAFIFLGLFSECNLSASK